MKKPVKVKKRLAALDVIENTELWNAVKKLEGRVDYACQVVADVRRESMYSPGFAEELTARSKALLNQGQFCVIGDYAKNGFGGNIGRTWKGTQQQAEDHAASILRNHPGCPELLVVQVVSKVGRKEPDIKITRV